jgi:nucleoside-diphosphate-sugar epimerase
MTFSILITGATGFVGSHLVKQLLADQFPVICALRTAQRSAQNIENTESHVVGDINDKTDWSLCLQNTKIIIHCAARVHVMNEQDSDPLNAFRQVNVQGTMRLAEQAAQAGVAQFIYISSVKVNGEFTTRNSPFTEESTPQPSDPYGISKHEAEVALLALGQKTGMAITIIRPPLVYGNGVTANFLSLLNWVNKKVPLPLGSIHNKRSFIYVENLVNLIVTCLQNPAAYHQIFFASDDEDVSTTELLQQAALALEVPSRLFPFPIWLMTFIATILGKKSITDRLCQSLQVDVSKAKTVLTWTPPFNMQQGLRASVTSIQQKNKTK